MTTLAEVLASDWDDVFGDSDGFAVAFSHTPLGGSPTTYRGIIEYGEDLNPSAFSDGMTILKQATIHTSNNGTATTGGPATIAEGDTVTINSVAWMVQGRPYQTGFGMQTISIVREVLREFSPGNEYRINR